MATVENPYQCKVGCTTCETCCPTDAITFPDDEYVEELIREHGLVARAREQVRDDGGSGPAGA
ncbi:MAG: hypothetical protein V5A46_10615 [Haloferacaceae archaeon]